MNRTISYFLRKTSIKQYYSIVVEAFLLAIKYKRFELSAWKINKIKRIKYIDFCYRKQPNCIYLLKWEYDSTELEQCSIMADY